MIYNYGSDQHKILEDILSLHLPNESTFECDVTYGSGSFYRKFSWRPKYCYDISPRFDFVECLLSSKVHDRHFGTLKSIVYDPPYLHSPGKSSIMGKRFGGYKNHEERMKDYKATLDSCYLALNSGGVLVMKCQDIVEGGKQKWVHLEVADHASYFWSIVDLFVLTNSNIIKGWNHGNQKHARKGTSYFWVFKKNHG